MHEQKRRWVKFFLILAVVVIFIIAIYFTFFFYYKCNDLGCYSGHQEKCAKTKFVNDQPDATWLYTIEGKRDGKCRVNVEILALKEGSTDTTILEGKSMDCDLTIGSFANPEADLSICHGMLKEELQNMIIQKLHKYIVDNVGKIEEGLEEPVGSA